MVRPFVDETVRYGEYSKPGEFIYDRPFQWGSRRIGPDLHREGGRRNHIWHYRHFAQPTSTSPGSVMPQYTHLYTDKLDYGSLQSRIDVLAMLGTPYDKRALKDAAAVARDQAQIVADELALQGGPMDVQDREVIAPIAYMQRLGTDIKLAAPAPAPAATPPPVVTPPVTPPPAPAEGSGSAVDPAAGSGAGSGSGSGSGSASAAPAAGSAAGSATPPAAGSATPAAPSVTPPVTP